MRCAVDFDESKPLYEQEVKAWGEMQSLNEEPSYKESDIKDEREKEFFKGYKFAFDAVCNILGCLEDEEDLTGEQKDEIEIRMSGELCMMLFSILDNECEFDDEEE